MRYYANHILMENCENFDPEAFYTIHDDQLFGIYYANSVWGWDILDRLDSFLDDNYKNYKKLIATKSGNIENQDGIIIATKLQNKHITNIYKE